TTGNIDTIKIIGKLPSEVAFSRSINGVGSVTNDLVVTINGTTDKLTVANYYYSGNSYRIEKVEFDNGTVWGTAEIDAAAQVLLPTGTALYATSGNDVVDLRNSVATVVRGPSGSSNNPGNDAYLFGEGAGQDVIDDYDTTTGNIDTIQIIGKLPSEVSLGRSVNGSNMTNDLVITINGTQDRLTVTNQFSGSSYMIEKIVFDNGQVWSTAEFNAAPMLPTTAGNLYATPGNDIVDLRNAVATGVAGSGGNNNPGNDTYLFGVGAGQDSIYDNDITAGNIDTIQIIGKLPSEVSLGRSVSGSNMTNDLVITINGTQDRLTVTNQFSGSSYMIEKIVFDNGQVWSTAEFNAAPMLPTAAGNLYATSGNDIVDLRNAVASDVSGSGGNSNPGNDTYLFGVGAGQDSVYDYDTTTGNIDTIKIVGKLPSEVTLNRSVNGSNMTSDLVITINGTQDRLTVKNQFSGGSYMVEKIVFDNGQVWSTAEFNAAPMLPIAEGNLYATSGNDSIDLRDAVASYVYGSGNNNLGNDTYLFGVGAGQDSIYDYDTTTGNIDTIRIIGKLPSEVTLSRSVNGANMTSDLVITINGTADELTVKNQFSGSSYMVEKIIFDNGTVWSTTEFNAVALLPVAEGNLYATSGNDTIDLRDAVASNVNGSGGNNNPGNDTYLFGLGAGQDMINDNDSTVGNIDTIKIIGKLPSDVAFSRSASGSNVTSDLVITINGTTDRLTVVNYYASGSSKVEKVEFDNGTVWGTTEVEAAAQVLLPTDTVLYTTSGNDVVDLRNAVATKVEGPNGGNNPGNDTYLFGMGAGQDMINDNDTTTGNVDTIKIIGKLPSEVAFSRSISGSSVTNDLVITINGTTDKLTVANYYANSSYRIEKVEFDNGTVWGTTEIEAAAQVLLPTGTALYTTSGNDVVDLRNGVATRVEGPNGSNNPGNDTYLFGVGAGQDTINDNDSTVGNVDTIKIIGKLPSEVMFGRSVSGTCQ
ncbi:MAG: hypothetical protein H7836_16705, partial [Magnetococcus sp. YQC-3]